jgi:hypothetical protein
LTTALETIGPPAAELMAAAAWRLLDRGRGTRAVVPSRAAGSLLADIAYAVLDPLVRYVASA